jgi:[ribosomal protein S5]-alanine N-acetyltransferase
MKLLLQPLDMSHAQRFLDAVARSESLHAPWVFPPSDADAFRKLVERSRGEHHVSYVAVKNDADLVGCINLSEIVRGAFQSAYLGFYAFVPFAGQGLMRQATQLALIEAFTTLGLHRLEANIQPANDRSKRFVASLGLRREGFSPGYLKIAGQWRDHERFAITVEQWNARPFTGGANDAEGSAQA